MAHTTSGFSLLEFIITITIVGILFAFIFPSQKYFLNKTTYEIESSRLLRAIQLTRSEAILHHTVATLCKSQDQQTCSGNWNNGYIIKVNNVVRYAFHSSKTTGELHWHAFPVYRDDLSFYPSGYSKVENGTFWYCPQNMNHPVWAIVINDTGRARLIIPDAETQLSCATT